MKRIIIVIAINLIALINFAQSQEDEVAIKAVVEGMATAWTNEDGTQYTQHFAEDHDVVTWFGMYRPHGQLKNTERIYQNIFSTVYKNTRQFAVVDKIRFLDKETALIHVFAAIVSDSEEKPEFPQVMWSGVLKKTGSFWKIISFHNVGLEILKNENMQRSSPIPMKEMFANWMTE